MVCKWTGRHGMLATQSGTVYSMLSGTDQVLRDASRSPPAPPNHHSAIHPGAQTAEPSVPQPKMAARAIEPTVLCTNLTCTAPRSSSEQHLSSSEPLDPSGSGDSARLEAPLLVRVLRAGGDSPVPPPSHVTALDTRVF